MLNWKKWCRLCGAFENNQEVDPDIEEVLIHIFEVIFKNEFLGKIFGNRLDHYFTFYIGFIYRQLYLLKLRAVCERLSKLPFKSTVD